jgi:conjugative transfer signal peptidase TraF
MLRARHVHRCRLARRAAALGLGVALLGATVLAPPAPRLVWNASASAPIGLYWVTPDAPIEAGGMVIAWLPGPYRALAAQRRYLPANVPLVKRVAAVAGDEVCALGPAIFVNGRKVAERLPVDGRGRPMPWWTGCIRLRGQERFLLMAQSPASFDGRYFGVTDGSDIVGKARLLWPR